MIDGHFALDCQVHSLRSHDGRASIRDICRHAVEIGLDVLGFSEHKDFDPADPVVDHFDYERYAVEIAEARREYRGAIEILMGVEVDYQRWFEPAIRDYLAGHRFDFVIGSVHYVDRVPIMTPEFLRGRTVEDAYRAYYDAVRESVESGLIDIVGHLEYANRRGVPAFGPFDPAPYHDQVADLLGRMIERGVALEINTAGLRQATGATYPCRDHVGLYARLDGRLLTIGSDAHTPADLAADYDAAMETALAAGLDRLAVYTDGEPRLEPIRRS